MLIPKLPAVILTEVDLLALEKLVNLHTVGQKIALRGRIILAAADGYDNTQIAGWLGITPDTARLWRDRWPTWRDIKFEDLSVEERLQDLSRLGAPPHLTVDRCCQIEALACKEPEEGSRPITHWTAREIADEIVKHGIVERISLRHAARL